MTEAKNHCYYGFSPVNTISARLIRPLHGQCTKKGTGNDKQGKDAGNRTLCPYRNFSQAIMVDFQSLKYCIVAKILSNRSRLIETEVSRYSLPNHRVSGELKSFNKFWMYPPLWTNVLVATHGDIENTSIKYSETSQRRIQFSGNQSVAGS